MSSSRTISVLVCALCSYAFRSVAGIAVFAGLHRTWTLDVADDGAGGVVHELNTDLGNTSTGTCEYVRTSFLSYMSSPPKRTSISWCCAYRYGPKRG